MQKHWYDPFSQLLSAHSHHTFTLCVLDLMHSFHASGLFSVLTTKHMQCASPPTSRYTPARLLQQLLLAASFKVHWLKYCCSVGVIDKQRRQQQLTLCPYSRASAATQLPKHAADGRWQRLVFCYCV